VAWIRDGDDGGATTPLTPRRGSGGSGCRLREGNAVLPTRAVGQSVVAHHGGARLSLALTAISPRRRRRDRGGGGGATSAAVARLWRRRCRAGGGGDGVRYFDYFESEN